MKKIQQKMKKLKAKRRNFIKHRENCYDGSKSYIWYQQHIHEIDYDIEILSEALAILKEEKRIL